MLVSKPALRNGRMCHLDIEGGPYRKNSAPPIRKWDGRLAPNQGQAGSPSRLRFAADGGVVNIDTGEYVETRPLLDAVRDQPLALPGDRERPGLYVLAVIAMVIVAVVMVFACGGGR